MMSLMTDMMVDIETMGTNPHTAGIFQISAIKFNYETEELGDMFDRYPTPLPFRGWSDSTREFWLGGQNRPVYEQLVARAEPSLPVYQDFVKFATDDAPSGGYRFWSKPTTFDFMFIADALESLGMAMPFDFRLARDLNSFAAGLKGNPDKPRLEDDVEFNGDKHNGLHDCAFQIDCLFHVKRRFTTAEVM